MAGPETPVAHAALTPPTPPSAAGAARKVRAEELASWPDRIDVRSPSEFAEDHIPGAENHPVLDDTQRAEVGTMYAKQSAFAAKRAGAALVARNIAAMLEGPFASKPRNWAPVVYCWRGGQRSRSLAHMLNEIGWRAVQLDGGYRAYRRYVMATLETVPAQLRFVVLCGLTGSGKSRLLAALAAEGAQTLDLEGLAKHRGSLLGDVPDEAQPSQKWFESQVADALGRFDPARRVYVESESKKIGAVQVPDSVLAAIREAPCIRVDTPLPMRVALLREEYAHFLAAPASLGARLSRLAPLHGGKTVERWRSAAAAGDWDALIPELLARHYDPTYNRAIERNFPHVADALVVTPADTDAGGFRTLAREVDAKMRARLSFDR